MASDTHEKYHEGPDAARRFEDAMGRVIRVTKEELAKREADYRQSRRRTKSRKSKKA